MATTVINLREVEAVACDMQKLVAKCFNLSKAQAKRLIVAGAVEIVEREIATKRVERRETAAMTGIVSPRSVESEILLRCGRRWVGVDFA